MDKYIVEEGTQKKPKVIIRCVEEKFLTSPDESILKKIKKQNDLDSAEFVNVKDYNRLGKKN